MVDFGGLRVQILCRWIWWHLLEYFAGEGKMSFCCVTYVYPHLASKSLSHFNQPHSTGPVSLSYLTYSYPHLLRKRLYPTSFGHILSAKLCRLSIGPQSHHTSRHSAHSSTWSLQAKAVACSLSPSQESLGSIPARGVGWCQYYVTSWDRSHGLPALFLCGST